MAGLRCLIVEDQKPAQRILQTYISRLEHIELVATCGSALEAMKLLQEYDVDLLFLDIHLPKMSGLSFLRSLSHPPNVVITTAYSEHAIEGFELDVADYLLKPFSFERFCKAVSKVRSGTQSNNRMSKNIHDNSVFIKVDGDLIRLDLSRLVHIASDGNFLNINMKDNRYYILGTLHSWLEKLPKDSFLRVQKSHIVNINYIEKITGNQIATCLGPVPIGRAYKDDLLRKAAGD
ncbi:LytR/AlgR family response regulator transcription factor [Kordiimonas aquimaris]|uniref:LytR/AlgR family response regulator transcription factor n=1 Tax=Kordiimonas aquimaris TaxID=707591 RepID=UPI0021D26308|nr:response regulator transcription factor [Kordiimonas aquimaris]